MIDQTSLTLDGTSHVSLGVVATPPITLSGLTTAQLQDVLALFQSSKQDSVDFLELCLFKGIHVVCRLALSVGNRVVGCALLVPRYVDNTYTKIACSYLHSIAVLPELRGCGIAKRLVQLSTVEHPVYTHLGMENFPARKLMSSAGLEGGMKIPSDVGRHDTPSLAALSGTWEDYRLWASAGFYELDTLGETRNDLIQIVKVPSTIPTLPNFELSSDFMESFAALQREYDIEHQWCAQSTITVVSAFGREVYLQPDLFDSSKLTLMLDNVACTIPTPFTKQQWVAITEKLQPQLAELNVRMFAPRPFDVLPCDGDAVFDNHFTWVDNEYVQLHPTWEKYLETLNAKRRYKVNAAMKEGVANGWAFTECDITEGVIDEMAEAKMFDHPNGEEDSNHLLRFHLYALAAQQFNEALVRSFCLRDPALPDGQNLIAFGSVIYRYGYSNDHTFYYFHSLSCVKDRNAATIWLVNVVKSLCTDTSTILDLTTGSDFEPHSYDTYKRVVANFTRKLGAPHCAVDRPHAYGPPVFTDRGWDLADTGD